MKLSKKDIIDLLSVNDRNDENLINLFQYARDVRSEVFQNKIFAYGFVYFSTYCKNNCNFCYFRKDNKIERYRKSKEEILETVEKLVDSGVNLIDLTMGEDLKYHCEEFKSVIDIIKIIKRKFDIPIMMSTGVVEKPIIDKFKDAGADWFALYQETHNRELFKNLRWDQDYDVRMNIKLYARENGLLIEEGILTGVGENYSDIADSILEMGKIGADQVRVMSFIPQKGSPMEGIKNDDRLMELKIIAIMRCLYPHSLIPASLDVDGISGLKDRINSGANLITSIIPPKSGFVGVAHETLDVEEGGRSVEEASEILSTLGLRIAKIDEYNELLAYYRRHL